MLRITLKVEWADTGEEIFNESRLMPEKASMSDFLDLISPGWDIAMNLTTERKNKIQGL